MRGVRGTARPCRRTARADRGGGRLLKALVQTMAVIKQASSTRAIAASGGVFDLGDLRRDAELALESARSEAARIVDEARQEAMRLREAAREEGLAAGRAEGLSLGEAAGRASGEAAGRAEAAAAHDEGLRAIEESFSAEFLRWIALRDERMRATEHELAGIAIAIAERIVAEHVRTDPAFIRRAVERAVALFSRATRVSIEIDPSDEPLVGESFPALRAALPAGSAVELVARAGVGRGGCVVRSSEGTVDARIETLFRRMREGLVGDAFADDAGDAGADIDGAPLEGANEAARRAANERSGDLVDGGATDIARDGAGDPPAGESA